MNRMQIGFDAHLMILRLAHGAHSAICDEYSFTMELSGLCLIDCGRHTRRQKASSRWHFDLEAWITTSIQQIPLLCSVAI